MSESASPEQFLREFYTEMSGATYSSKDDFDKKLRGWAKLLKLREDAARLDQINLLKGAEERFGSINWELATDGIKADYWPKIRGGKQS